MIDNHTGGAYGVISNDNVHNKKAISLFAMKVELFHMILCAVQLSKYGLVSVDPLNMTEMSWMRRAEP